MTTATRNPLLGKDRIHVLFIRPPRHFWPIINESDNFLLPLGYPTLAAYLREHLPGASWVGVGITLSFLSGDVSRAPRWMRRVGLEWSWRLICEPRRLFKRYILQGLPFALRLFFESACSRWTERPGELTS